jgi:hypothetical protein
MRARARLAIVALVCAGALASGVPGAGAVAPTGAARASQGYAITRVKAAGLAFALPSGWLRLDPKSKSVNQIIERVAAKNPRLRTLTDQFSALRGSILFWGIDAGATGFATNLLISPQAFDRSIVDHPDQAQAALSASAGKALTDLRVAKAKVGGARALRITYVAPVNSLDGATTTAYGTMLIVPTHKGMMQVTYTSGSVPAQDATLAALVKTMRLT